MKFLYKIYSGYDGFSPARIPERLLPGKLLRLSWARYLDSVEVGDEVWVYFHGPHHFNPGVYVQGYVRSRTPETRQIDLRVRDYQTEAPLTDAATSERIARVVAARGLQVFVYPEEWDIPPKCTVASTAQSCGDRSCGSCATWKRLPLVKEGAHGLPHRLNQNIRKFVPAYWVIPSRCYLHRTAMTVALSVKQSSNMFYRFKTGISSLAFPLALGIYKSLQKRGLLDFDGIVPIPLSPDKAQAKEINRTALLARELAKLLGTRVTDVLLLNRPISKHRLRTELGFSASQFEQHCKMALVVENRVRDLERILLIDDVCTEGSTLRCAADRILELNPKSEIVAATAGQMILKSVIRDESSLIEK